MAKKSTFGKEPDRLKRLLSIGLEEEDADKEASATASLEQIMEKPGGEIGRYKLLSILGEGGMGIVYLAEQKEPIKRQVALKIIKPGMDTKRVIARFEAERQALALLDHPNIAHVHDAGTTGGGRPYFVMEYVKGLPITEFCDRHKLTVEDRLGLFVQVCQAIQHAHQKAIIHRDIKPSNILVSTQDDNAMPKIIDFGVAKALSQPLTERTLATEETQLLGTPEYMSPEQADMANEDIDTRSDIYSLGVLLYVLLTGVLPFDPEALRKGGIDHIRHIIRDTDPKTPSTRLSNLGDEGSIAANNRRTEVIALTKRLHKELEWIPLKAMRKDRAERYRSASELVDDIQNYLKGDPLIAGPPRTLYRMKKSVRRHKALVTGTLAVLLVSLVGTVVSTLFAIGQARARTEAQAVSDFLTSSVLRAVNPIEGGQRETALCILDLVSEGLADKFEHRPLVEASIHYELGFAYRRLSTLDSIKLTWQGASIPNLDQAEHHLKRAYELYVEQLGEENKHTLLSMQALGAVYMRQARLDEAESLLERTAQINRRIFTDEYWQTMWSRNALALVYWGQKRYDEAESLYFELLKISRQVFGEDHETSVLFTGNLARIYEEQGRHDDAEHMYLKVLQLWPDIVHCENPHMALFMSCFAHMYLQQERYDEAEPLLLDVLENRRIKRGEMHLATLETVYFLGIIYKNQSRYDKAESFLLKVAWGRRLALGDEHPDTSEAWHSLIELYEAWGKPQKAEEWRAKLPLEQANPKDDP